MLTLLGEKMSERVSSSIVLASGLPNSLVCETMTEYEERAVVLAMNPDELLEMRSLLEDTRDSSFLFNTQVTYHLIKSPIPNFLSSNNKIGSNGFIIGNLPLSKFGRFMKRRMN